MNTNSIKFYNVNNTTTADNKQIIYIKRDSVCYYFGMLSSKKELKSSCCFHSIL